MPPIHQFAAIMFTDIVGYTALMGDDEQKAFEILRQNRRIQKPLIQQFGGTWIKELGDGMLSSFSIAENAVKCASAIQKACRAVEGLQLRIGIHSGKVIIEGGDVFGDVVNIALRVQANASVGEIWVSETVHNDIAGNKSIETKFIKEEYLKHVKEPIRLYAVQDNQKEARLTGSKPPKKEGLLKTPPDIPEKSIAVLPFLNMSSDPEQEYFSEGMAEEILTSLSHLKDLKVAGRTSSFQFRGKNVDVKEVREKLHVSSVLVGSVHKQENQVKIIAQLVNTSNHFPIWSEEYHRDMDDIFAIQDEIASAITEKLKVTLLDDEKSIINKSPTKNKEAYELYLKGRFFWNKRGQGLIKGLEYFQQSEKLDPNFALAHAGIADTYALLAFYSVLAPHIAMPKARKAAERAIELDPARIEAYATLAFVTFFYEWNWRETRKKFQDVFTINPNYPPAHYWYSLYVAWIEGDFEEAIREAKKSTALEPLVANNNNNLAVAYINAGKFEDGQKMGEAQIEFDPNSFLGYFYLGVSLGGLKKYDEAIAVLQTAVNLSNRHQWPLIGLCWSYALAGNMQEVHNIYNELILRQTKEYSPGLFACLGAYLTNNLEDSQKFFDLAIEQHDSSLLSFRVWPFWEPLRNEAYFIEKIKALRFPE